MRKRRKTAYELSESQVTTPKKIVSLFWRLAHKHRPRFESVLDMGAGDARFSKGGKFASYLGLEIDPTRSKSATIPQNAEVINQCAFQHKAADYDACIGNPPYVRHHDLEKPWKEKTVRRLEKAMGISLHRNGNLYLHFMCLGLLKTRADGLLALVIPYEWVSRPSAKSVREYIIQNKWDVKVYRFTNPIFQGVLTTASITIIDKGTTSGKWSYFDVDEQLQIQSKATASGSDAGVLPYTRANVLLRAMRGLSPGSQEIFTLTEGERIRHGIRRTDVTPCVTTFRNLPSSVQILNDVTFEKYFVKAGERCWLIKSYQKKISPRLADYLEAIPEAKRSTWTCLNQTPWYRFRPHPVPAMLFSSGFVSFGPKFVINEIGAVAVGSVFGIHGQATLKTLRALRRHLTKLNFENQLVPHAAVLKKVEVKQFNSVLNGFFKHTNGKAA